MESIILFILLAIVIILLLWIVFSKKGNNENGLIINQINDLRRTVDDKMSESTKQMTESVRNQFTESAKLIKDVTQGLYKTR